jgi:hypothetical protein
MNSKHCSNLLLVLSSLLLEAGANIINVDKKNLNQLQCSNINDQPNREFLDTAALWGDSLLSDSFVVMDSNQLAGLILGIISKANTIKDQGKLFLFQF